MSRPAEDSPRERRVVAGLQQGDPEALASLHADFGRPVFGFLVQMLPDRATAEDVFQRVFCEVWERGAQYDPERASLLTWVMTITRSRAIDELRRRRPEPFDPAELPEEEPGSSEEELLLERWRVRRLLDLLPPDEAEVLRLRFYEELTQAEITEATGIKLGTVKTRMVRGLERLRELIEEEARRELRPAEPLALRGSAGVAA